MRVSDNTLRGWKTCLRQRTDGAQATRRNIVLSNINRLLKLKVDRREVDRFP